MVLDHPDIPLHTNGSESDIRCQVTKRAISGGTRATPAAIGGTNSSPSARHAASSASPSIYSTGKFLFVCPV